MPQSPPRKRFQVHLSTAIVLMFVTGALIWANVAPSISLKHYFTPAAMRVVEFTCFSTERPFQVKEDVILNVTTDHLKLQKIRGFRKKSLTTFVPTNLNSG